MLTRFQNKRPRKRLQLRAVLGSLLVGGALLLMLPVTGFSAYYHDLVKNRQPCADCHTLHYSEDASKPAGTEAGGPFQNMLTSATTNKLCLFCHDGSDPNAPDVLGPVNMYAGSGDEHSAAGYFDNSGGFANQNGHDLGLTASVVPFSSKAGINLNCASCHDPHGTLNSRNLLSAPIAGGNSIPQEPGTQVFHQVPPSDPPSASGSISAYRRSNSGYQGSSSAWCTECHDQLKSTLNTPVSRVHHLVDVPLNGSGYPTDPAHWVGGTGSGFGLVTGDAIEGVPRLGFQVSTATDFPTSTQVAATNEVVCGSCHLAHGGSYKYGLTWPYRESGTPTDKDSGCQQCHNF